MRNDLNTRHTELKSAGWNIAYETDNGWTHQPPTSSYSAAKRTDVIFESYSGAGPAGVGATDTHDLHTTPGAGTTFGSIAGLHQRDPVRADRSPGLGRGQRRPAGALTQAGFYNTPAIKDELNAIRLVAERDTAPGVRSTRSSSATTPAAARSPRKCTRAS